MKKLTASQWVSKNWTTVLNYAGRWVAVTSDGIVASSEDFDEVFKLAEQQGVHNPLVFHVSSEPRGKRA